MVYLVNLMKKQLEEPNLLTYSGITTIHNNINKNGLKWAMPRLPSNRKLTFKFKEKSVIFSIVSPSVFSCTGVVFANTTVIVFVL